MTAEKAITYAPSRLAFAARYILPPTIFDALDRTSPGKGGELQLTNGILLLLKEGTLGYSIKLTDKEKHYDITSDHILKLLLTLPCKVENIGIESFPL